MIPVIISGGSGTRLWPVSRAAYPKQFCEILDESLLSKTVKRLLPFGSPWALTVESLSVLTNRLFREMKLPAEQIILEPMGRNTAPAIALLCRVLELRGRGDEVVGVFPADHLVLNEAEFGRAVRLAEVCARKDQVVTLGIKPEYPATGFGYIETKTEAFASEDGLSAFRVVGFREKPDENTARGFLARGCFSWNAGMFVFRVSTMCKNFQVYMPELWQAMQRLEADMQSLKDVYASCKSISIDYGVMEKLTEQVCIPCDIGWSDLGSWDDVARFSDPAAGGQAAAGGQPANRAEAVLANSQNCFVFSNDQKVYGLVGMSDTIVVDTPDAMLIARKGSSQDVREVVEKLSARKHVSVREHRSERRPWGGFSILRDTEYYKSKIIVVDPGQQLSYQSHSKRAEHWIMVRGRGEVVLDDKVIPVENGVHVFIPQGAKHRIRNTGQEPLEFIEVQTGTYFGEDDIVRYQDDYNRK